MTMGGPKRGPLDQALIDEVVRELFAVPGLESESLDQLRQLDALKCVPSSCLVHPKKQTESVCSQLLYRFRIHAGYTAPPRTCAIFSIS